MFIATSSENTKEILNSVSVGVCSACIHYLQWTLSTQLVMDVNVFASVHVWTSWVASMMDVAHKQPDAKLTLQLSPL